MVWTLSQVALGGAIGACVRFMAMSAAGAGAPLATLLVNVAGCFAMGLLCVTLATRFSPLLVTGLLGGFTTFSAFSLDALKLWEAGQIGAAALYVGSSVLLSLLAVGLGAAIAREIFA